MAAQKRKHEEHMRWLAAHAEELEEKLKERLVEVGIHRSHPTRDGRERPLPEVKLTVWRDSDPYPEFTTDTAESGRREPLVEISGCLLLCKTPFYY